MICSLSPELRLKLDGVPEPSPEFRVEEACDGDVAVVRLAFQRPPGAFRISWSIPQHDIQYRWTSVAGKIGEDYPQFLPPSWLNGFASEFTRNAPLCTLVGAGGRNRLTAAVSDAKNRIKFFAGVGEESFAVECRLEFPALPEAAGYRVELRLDLRDIPFEQALADAAAWWESFPEFRPCPVPPAAFEGVYSTWYSYHREITARAVEAEAEAFSGYGIRTVIVDDGWQETGGAAGYAFAGDWNIDRDRFPDMAAHVARVRARGVNYLLWIALPFVGEGSPAFSALKGKLLYFAPGLNCWILDPRFPDVREALIAKCLELSASLRLDGLKIDFLDRFALPSGTVDPAEKEGPGGRDTASIPEAVDRLLTGLTDRLRTLRPDFLIEYRQDYVGPAMRRLANLFRASDCPGDRVANRRRIINLRLLSGDTAVHSDMLGWHSGEPVESAARQLWNVIFSVPQISVRLETLPEDHRRMLRFLLAFWREHRALFLNGKLSAPHPELNYPMVSAADANGAVTVVYQEGQGVTLAPHGVHIVVNASAAPELYLDNGGAVREGRLFDCCGGPAGSVALPPGLSKVAIPPSGFLAVNADR